MTMGDNKEAQLGLGHTKNADIEPSLVKKISDKFVTVIIKFVYFNQSFINFKLFRMSSLAHRTPQSAPTATSSLLGELATEFQSSISTNSHRLPVHHRLSHRWATTPQLSRISSLPFTNLRRC